MTPEEAQFVAELRNFNGEAHHAAYFLYASFSIDHAAAQSQRLLNRLNRTPTFWLSIRTALRTSVYITIARVFDQKSPHNIDRLIGIAQRYPAIFAREALRERKMVGAAAQPEWLGEYLDAAFYPTQETFRALRRRVASNRRVFERTIRPARNRFLAHREVIDQQEVSRLYAGGTVGEIWKLSVFLIQLHEVLWELLNNGRRPTFRPRRYSVPAMFRVPPVGGGPHERMVREALEAMRIVEGPEAQPAVPADVPAFAVARRGRR